MNETDELWDNIQLIETDDNSDDAAEATEPEAEEEIPNADQQDEDNSEASQENGKNENHDTFTLKYMNEEKSVTREEVIPLAQKGMDYDRIRGKLTEAENKIKDFDSVTTRKNELEEQLHWIEEMAKEQGVTVDEMIDATRANILSRKTGKDIEVAKGIIANEREKRKLDLEKTKAKETTDSGKKRDEDINNFLAEYPDLTDPKDIPQEVWNAVHSGETLLNAYRKYENSKLKEELAKQKALAEKAMQKKTNKERSTGSQANGDDSYKSLVEEIWSKL